MVIEFEDKGLQELYETGKTTDRRYKKLAKDKAFVDDFIDVINIMYDVDCTSQLSDISFLKYEKLKYNLSGLSSVRIVNNRVERLIFTEHEGGILVKLLEINQEHYGKKK